MKRGVIGLLLVAVVAAGALLGWGALRGAVKQPLEAGVRFDSPLPVEDFTLLDGDGQPRPFSSLRGKHVVLFFGYTNCPDVCPATLAELKLMMPMLGRQAEKVEVVLITVDPTHDTPERMAQYLAAFDERFIGLTGRPELIEAVATRFGIYCEPMEAKMDIHGVALPGPTLIDHTASILVIDPAGYLVALFPGSTRAEPLAADLRRLLQ